MLNFFFKIILVSRLTKTR